MIEWLSKTMIMAKNNKKSKESKLSKIPKIKLDLKDETKQTIIGIICLGIALILILSFFNMAGVFGFYIHKYLIYLFGWFYFLSPIILIIAGIIFLASLRHNIYASTVFGLFLITAGFLGASDIINQNSTGIFGRAVGSIEGLLGFWGGLVVCILLSIIGLIIIFEFSIQITRKEKVEEEYEDENIEEEIDEEEPEEKKPGLLDKIIKKGKEKESPVKPIAEEKIDLKSKKINSQILANWNFPTLDLLEADSGKPNSGDIKTYSQIIKRTLANFGIPVEMDEISIGPTVTRYTLKPAEGVKLSKIIALQNDLSLALAAHPIRIEAPIPGKSLVGIEVPNRVKADVRLKNLLSLDGFADGNLLTVPAGRDVSGQPIFIDIAKMPHLLVAGSTGSGKSVSIHTIISSLLFKNTPETLRLLMIDPKRVELTTYNHLPHLVSDVITQPKKAIMALRWATLEMDKRYDELEEAKSRDINSFNQKALKAKKPMMPYILIFIDELADLMVTYGREVEASIVRLAQMARATGIHLIVSTQRPSTDVITGLIKANIPARIALKVASQIDSRTILDMSGAEKLIGRGDLLFMAAESGKPKRIQGAFVSEEEVQRVVKYILDNNKDYSAENVDEEEFEQLATASNGGIPQIADNRIDWTQMDELGDSDDLYPDAYKIVVESSKASTSFLQRRLRIGYARAARLMDMLEERGVISAGDGAKARDVLIAPAHASSLEDEIPEASISVIKEAEGIESDELIEE